MVPAQLLGLDLGTKRTGIARASVAARLAEPMHTVSTDSLIDTLKDLISKNKADKIVVGLPRSLAGRETSQTEWVRQWLKQAQKELPGVEFELQDEALTTEAAIARAGKNVTDLDAEAAAIILQNFMDSNEVKHEKA